MNILNLENIINPELTQLAVKQVKYQKYIEWLKQNGALFQSINFPTAFGDHGYIGIAASEDIPPNKAIIAIPNKLIISTLSVMNTEVGQIIEDNNELFEDQECEDGDFNKLTLFLMLEKVKDQKSFWAPYLSVNEDPTTISKWTQKELDMLEDPHLKKQAQEYVEGLEDTWKKFDAILKKYPKLFPKNSYNKNMFIWAFELVMTRCFGWNLPGTFLVPLVDFFNHDKRGVNYFLFHKKYEETEKSVPSEYIIKKKRLDCMILKGFKDNLNPQEREYLNIEPEPIIQYINQQRPKFTKQPPQFIEDKNREELMDYIRDVNYKYLNEFQQQEIWNLPYFSTTEDEDNDSDEEGDTISKNEDYKQIKQNEQSQMLIDVVPKQEQQQQLQQSNEEIKNSDIQTINLKNLTSQNNQSKNLTGFDIDKCAQNRKEKYKTDLQEEEWEWYSSDDDQIYFIVTTQRFLKKNTQIHLCYGRRSNRFLMLWYGFCIRNNHYDSMPFRLHLKQKNQDLLELQHIKDSIFLDYISFKDSENGFVQIKNEKVDIQDLTKEFRIKDSCLCEDLLTYLRVHQLNRYQGIDSAEILVTLPSSLNFEQRVIELAIKILEALKDQYIKTPIEVDDQMLQNPSLSWKDKFSIIYRREHKKHILVQLNLLKIIREILNELIRGTPLKQAYTQQYEKLEKKNEDFILNRERLRQYLRQVYIGIVLKKYIN